MRYGVDIKCGVKARIDHWIRGGIFDGIEKQSLCLLLQPSDWFQQGQLRALFDGLPESQTVTRVKSHVS